MGRGDEVYRRAKAQAHKGEIVEGSGRRGTTRLSQDEINIRVWDAKRKQNRGENLTNYEHTLLQYAFPPACHACGMTHNKASLNVRPPSPEKGR
jgi:hypothetical protein